MIEVKIPKEIRDYKDKLFFGLTVRQTICVALALVINVPLYRYLSGIIGDSAAGWIVIVTALPVVCIGFIPINGIPFEKIAVQAVRLLLHPQRYVYQTENIYDEYDFRGKENKYEKQKGKKQTAARKKAKEDCAKSNSAASDIS